MSLRTRIYISLAIGMAVLVIRLLPLARFGNDTAWPHCYAQQLLAGGDPYGPACRYIDPATGQAFPANPLTTAVVLLPLAPLSQAHAAALAAAAGAGLLAFALLRGGQAHRLLVLLSAPALHALWYAQWAVLLLAAALLPALLPLTLVKPHIGLPIALTRLTRRRALACATFGLATLLILPDWPLRWLGQIGGFSGYVPLLTVPGALLALALLRWRDPDARYLLLCAAVPQRALYDAPILAAALRSRAEVLAWTLATWLYWPLLALLGAAPPWPARLIVLCAYLPLLALLLRRPAMQPRGRP
ncbi:hypothetical protein [Kouleothrix sp.]|uniref:hypothetical protein n=1 Tax=Kouleothrix sp. TaxID=2779161 RepID=UPI00391DB453